MEKSTSCPKTLLKVLASKQNTKKKQMVFITRLSILKKIKSTDLCHILSSNAPQ